MRKKRIFVCYSRKDKRWFDEGSRYDLIPWLNESLGNEVCLWYDRELRKEPGKFKERILAEINRADAVILLISQNFLNSTFINKVELPRIRERADEDELIVIPVLVGPAIWKQVPTFITDRQVLPGDEPEPLLDYSESVPAFQKVRVEILEAIQDRLSLSPPDSPGGPGGYGGGGTSDGGMGEEAPVFFWQKSASCLRRWWKAALVVLALLAVIAALIVFANVPSQRAEISEQPVPDDEPAVQEETLIAEDEAGPDLPPPSPAFDAEDANLIVAFMYLGQCFTNASSEEGLPRARTAAGKVIDHLEKTGVTEEELQVLRAPLTEALEEPDGAQRMARIDRLLPDFARAADRIDPLHGQRTASLGLIFGILVMPLTAFIDLPDDPEARSQAREQVERFEGTLTSVHGGVSRTALRDIPFPGRMRDALDPLWTRDITTIEGVEAAAEDAGLFAYYLWAVADWGIEGLDRFPNLPDRERALRGASRLQSEGFATTLSGVPSGRDQLIEEFLEEVDAQ